MAMKKLRKGSIEISAELSRARNITRRVSLASPFRGIGISSSGRHEQADIGPSGAIRLEVRTGYLLYRAIRKLSLGRQGLISRRGGRLARVDSTRLCRLSFEDCLDLGGAPRPGGVRDVVLVSITGPAWKSSAIITRAPWRR